MGLLITDRRLGSKRDGGLQVMAAGLLATNAAVVALTAYPDDANRLAAQRLGATHFLQKPVDLDIIARIAAAHGFPSALNAGPGRRRRVSLRACSTRSCCGTSQGV